MPFTITDRDIRQYDSTTILRCDECGSIERVEDQPLDDAAMDEAERHHQCIPMCCACGEIMPELDRAMLACLPCRMDDPEGTERAVTAHIEAMTVSDMRAYLARQRQTVSA